MTKRTILGKRLGSVLLAVALALALIPGVAFAADEPIWVNGVDIMQEPDMTLTCGGGTARFDTATRTLTLTNATIETGSSGIKAGIQQSSGDLKIALVGNNTIGKSVNSDLINGIWTGDGDIAISGTPNSSLTIYIKQVDEAISACGIFAGGTVDKVTLQDVSMAIYEQSGNTSHTSHGILAYDIVATRVKLTSEGFATAVNAMPNALTITDCDMTLQGRDFALGSKGATIINDAVLDLTGGEKGNGVYSQAQLTVKDTAITAESGWPALFGVGDLHIEGGTLEATTQASVVSTNGKLFISKGAVLDLTGEFCGLISTNNSDSSLAGIRITDSSVEADSAADHAIFTGGTMEIGGTSKVITRALQCGLFATGDMTLNGGTIQADSQADYAIFTRGALAVNGKTDVTANGAMVGMYGAQGVTLDGGVVRAKGTANYGLSTPESLTIGKDATVTAEGEWCGLYTEKGMTINGTVDAKGADGTAIYAETTLTVGEKAKVTAKSRDYNGIYAVDGMTLSGRIDAVGGTVQGSNAGIAAFGPINITGGFIHAKGGTNHAAIITKVQKGGEDAATAQITLTSPLGDKNGAKVAVSDWFTTSDIPQETRSFSTFIAKSESALTLDEEGFVTNPVNEVWLGDFHAVTLSGTGTGGTSGDQYAAGETVSIQAGKKSGYTFQGWTATPAVTFANASSENTTFVMPASDVALTATWAVIPPTGGGSGSGGGGGGGGIVPTTPDSAVIVDGKTESIGKVETTTNGTTVVVDQGKLSNKIAAAKDGSAVVVPVSNTKASASAQLVVKSVQEMAKKNMTLEVQVGPVTYALPTTAIDVTALLTQLGAADPAKVRFTVTITADDSSKVAGVTLVGTPTRFSITADYNGQTVRVDDFDSMVPRSVEVSKNQAEKITTGVVIENGKVLRHVPTKVYQQGGKYFATMRSMTNSTYALIEGSSQFTDVSGKWYENAANELSARQITNAVFGTTFEGDKPITRAQFAALLVNGLGLPQTVTADFNDVSANAWYAKAVATANRYGIVQGMGEKRFAPDATITRQEAMVMLTRAAKLIAWEGDAAASAGFVDMDKVSTWALDAVAFNTVNGLIIGDGGYINPTGTITRAETGTVLLRLLQKADLVDVRTNI